MTGRKIRHTSIFGWNLHLYRISSYLYINIQTMEKEVIPQSVMRQWFLPMLQTEGILYRKTQQVLARKAVEGERIRTVTQDGLETTNVADADDYVVQNLTDMGEQYIVNKPAFEKKYALAKNLSGDFDQYNPVSSIIALELTEARLTQLGLAREFHFLPIWNEPMQARQGDFLACPTDFSEIYRVARHEFFQTYALVQ